MPRTFTYEVLLRIDVTEDNPDMPTLNVRTLGDAIAKHTETMTACEAHCVAAHLTSSKPVPVPRSKRPVAVMQGF